MSPPHVRVSPAWLQLREQADGAARSAGLAASLRPAVRGGGVRVVHDLGCGCGSMGRWLGPRLDGPQHWVLHDLDTDLLRFAHSAPPPSAPGAPPVTVETRVGDVTRLGPADLEGASLVTASALLDLLTQDELERLIAACAATAAPLLVTLSVTGRVGLAPADPLDATVRDAFNDHQRRTTPRGELLGPDAARVAVGLLHDLRYLVRVRPSPWRLHADPALTRAWLTGWVAAAVEQEPTLADEAERYLGRRLRQLDAGDLWATVQHLDLLASPGGGAR